MEPTRPFDGRIAVFCRFRPFSPREQECSGAPAYRQLDKATVEMASLKEGETINYSFDSVFGGQASQAEVYELTTQPIVSKVFSGYNGAVMAYGQTASGKTHTMQGPPDARQPD
jgi:kinesin family protein 5